MSIHFRPFSRTRGAIAFLLGIFISSAVSSIAADDNIGQAVGSVVIPAGISASQVKDTIIRAFTGREWGIKSEAEDRVVGYLKHRSNEAQLTLIFDHQKIDLFCLGWQINKKTGEREKPELPTGWINNIKSDITKLFNRAVTTK